MTTNQTIDAVSRKAIEQALLAMKSIYQAGYDRIIDAGGTCDAPEYMMERDPTARELRALLDAAPNGWKPCSPELLESGVDCAAAPRWSSKEWDGHSHWHPAPASPPQGVSVARIEGLYGDPEAFAEREIRSLCDVNKLKIGTLLYAEQPAPVAVVLPEKYDDVLLPFLSLMRAELHANAHKGDRSGWLKMDGKTAILEVFYHMGKLHQAVHRGESAAIKEYAADVANMCMMLLDVCDCLDEVTRLNTK